MGTKPKQSTRAEQRRAPNATKHPTICAKNPFIQHSAADTIEHVCRGLEALASSDIGSTAQNAAFGRYLFMTTMLNALEALHTHMREQGAGK